MAEANSDNDHKTKVKSSEYKIFNDPVHGKIRLHPLLVKIIDTPQFQRLRNIKQLGAVYYVYPGASHNRFEHSIGTCHLAGLLVRHLKQQLEEEKKLPDDPVNDEDVLCVEIAALCHDLGHGPFSHAFDNNFAKKFDKYKNWTHEQMSIDLFDHMFTDNETLKTAWTKYYMTNEHKKFISNLINPPDNYWLEPGFSENKAFLYEIVSNKRTCIDVDKFDYFARDALYLGLHSNFDHMRYIYGVRVLRDQEGHTRICCREKDLESLYDLFHLRHLLHRRAYQHKNAKIVEEMIIEAFVEADKSETAFFSCPPNKQMKLSETIGHPEAYTYVTDHVFHQILCSTDDSGPMKIARQILDRVNKRDLYTCVAVALVTGAEAKLKSDLVKEMKECLVIAFKQPEDQFVVTIINMNYGKKNKDPLENQPFYRKAKDDVLEVQNPAVSEMIKPKVFMEERIMVYCKNKLHKEGQEEFKEWCKKQEYRILIDF